MTSLRKNRGMTLTELIVASVLVGIIMLGVVAFSVSLSQMESSSNKSSLLAMQSVSLLSAIRKDFNLATGDGTDWGIYIPTTLPAGQYYISIRRDNNGTPDDYDNDTWVVYVWDKVSKLKRCEQTIETRNQSKTAFAVPTANCSSPNYSDAKISILASNVSKAKFELKLNNLTWVPGSAAPVNPETFSGQCILNVVLTALYDPTKAPNKSVNPMFNLETSILSSTHSW